MSPRPVRVTLRIAFLLSLALVFSQVMAQEATIDEARSFFTRGNLAYKENKYEEAVVFYEKALKAGYESGALYYNLGNSFVKTGLLGKAALNYERVAALQGSDSDTEANYQYVRSILGINVQAVPGARFYQWLDRLFSGVSIDLATTLLLLCYVLILIVSAAHVSLQQYRRITVPVIIVLILFILPLAVALKRKISFYNNGAIVTDKQAFVKYEPYESATTYFRLEEGSRVMTIERSGEWYKIQRADNKIGWIKASSIGLINSSQ